MRLLLAGLPAPLRRRLAERHREDRRAATSRAAAPSFGKYLYVDSYGSGVLHRIDPATNKVVKRVKIGSGPCGVVAGAGALWAEDYYQNAILRVNPATMKVTNRIFVGKKPWDVAYGFGSAWASNAAVVHGLAHQREDAQGREDDRGRTARRPASAQGAGSIWVGLAEQRRHRPHRSGDEHS